MVSRRGAAEQRDELATFHSIELHLLPQSGTSWQHTALARIKLGLIAVRDFDPAHDRSSADFAYRPFPLRSMSGHSACAVYGYTPYKTTIALMR
jgi:hypothetical protein